MRKFFREKCNIVDNKIYESMGPKKFEIKSYMGVGVLGRFERLIFVLGIDSEEADKFVDFETLKQPKSAILTKEEGKITIEGGSEKISEDFPFPLPKILRELLQAPEKDQEAGLEKRKDFVRMVKMAGVFSQVSHSIKVGTQGPAFLYPLSWSLKQIKEIFTEAELE